MFFITRDINSSFLLLVRLKCLYLSLGRHKAELISRGSAVRCQFCFYAHWTSRLCFGVCCCDRHGVCPPSAPLQVSNASRRHSSATCASFTGGVRAWPVTKQWPSCAVSWPLQVIDYHVRAIVLSSMKTGMKENWCYLCPELSHLTFLMWMRA